MRQFLTCIIVLVVTAVPAGSAGRTGEACDAIARLVADRMGPLARVTTCVVEGDAPGPWAFAAPDTGARLGRPMWFTLRRSDFSDAHDGLTAVARVRVVLVVEAEHASATRLLPRGTVLTSGDVRIGQGRITGVPMEPLPAASAVLGGRVVRVVEAGSAVLAADIAPARVVKAGDRVVATVRIGAVEVSAAVTAVDGGAVGDTIRVSNRENRRVLQARVLGPGRVEVLYVR